MDIESWSNIFSAFGTVSAAAVAAYSVRLAWKQVSLQFEPNLIIRSDRFQIQTTNSLKEDFIWRKPSTEARYINGGSEDYNLTILNVGNGPAFDIRVYAEFDYIATHEDVMSKLSKYKKDINIRYDEFGCHANLDGQGNFGFRLPDEAFGIIDALGGVNTDDREKTCIIDPSLKFFSVCYAHYFKNKFQNGESGYDPNIITVNFRLEYIDSSGNRKIKKQKMTISVEVGRYRLDGADGVTFVSIH